MNLPELSIQRHVFAIMLNAVLVLFGVIAYQRIGIDRFPYIEFPVVSVTTTQQGANPDIIDASVTSLIETSVNTVPGIEHIQSSSSPGVSIVAVTFDLDKDIDIAFNEVQAKVNQILRRLPEDAEPPVIAKVETNASPIMWLALQGDRTQQQLNQYARLNVKKRLETIDGVGEVRLGGRRDRTIRVNLQPARMAAFGITAQDLIGAFAREHVQLPGGFLVADRTENLLKLDLEFHNLDTMQTMIVAYRDGAPVRLKDVAQIEDGLADYRQLARFNGTPSIGIGIVKIANTNTVEIIDQVLNRLETEIVPSLPPGMTIKIVSNDALFIKEMVRSLKEHLVEGTILAAAIVWLFLRSFRSTLIIALAIPVSLMGAVAVMYFSGFTFNSLTLLALLLLIGVVVDDSIVVLENIFRHRQQIDPDPISAAKEGTREVQFAVLASTLSLVAIFAPVIFLGGIVGKFFKSFAVVVTFGVLVSLFVSLTLTPMLCSRYLKVETRHGRVYRALDRLFNGMDRVYRRLLDTALAHRLVVLALTVLVVASSAFFFAGVGKTFVPEQDEGRFMVQIKAPLGSSIDYTNERLREIEKVLGSHEEIASYFTAIGLGVQGQVNKAIAVVRLQPFDERELRQQELIPILRSELAQIPGVQAFPAPVAIVGGQRGEPLQFVLTGPNLNEVSRLSLELQRRLAGDAEMGKLDLDLQLDLPQYVLSVDRTRAAALGISARDIAASLNMFTGGLDIGQYNDDPGDGERYDVRLKAVEGKFVQLADLPQIYLRSRDNTLVRLDSVATFKQTLGAAVVGRFDLQYAANFYGSPTIPLGQAVANVRQTAQEILPLGYSIKLVGQAEEFAKTVDYMVFAFVLAMILLYMVLASQFNSFVQPFIIMLAQPLAIVGGVAALWLSIPIAELGKTFGAELTPHTLNIYSMIGLVLLIGLVAKNSILLVDLTNQRREQGLKVDEALRNACPIRLRPVLMTSATMILALLPAALGFGAGSETNGPLAVAVIGGLISSTLLTLVVVPAVYSLVENGIVRWRSRRSS